MPAQTNGAAPQRYPSWRAGKDNGVTDPARGNVKDDPIRPPVANRLRRQGHTGTAVGGEHSK